MMASIRCSRVRWKSRHGFTLLALTALGLGLLGSASLSLADETGSLVGMVDNPRRLSAVFAVDRNDKNKKYPGQFNAEGHFTVSALPLDRVYDCIVDAGSHRLEGINLQVPLPTDYDTEDVDPKELLLKESDRAELTARVKDLNQFEDQVEILVIEGNIQHAVILLNKLRTKPFFASNPGEVIWRPEIWRFERPDEHWVKIQDELFVILYRERLQGKVYNQKNVVFDSRLGGLRPTSKTKIIALGKVVLPQEKAGIHLRIGDKLITSQLRAP